jgi:hypothetical protein
MALKKKINNQTNCCNNVMYSNIDVQGNLKLIIIVAFCYNLLI